MPMYNLVEYSDIILILQEVYVALKRDKINDNVEVTNGDNALSFKYKGNPIGNTETNGTKKKVRIAAPLKYLSNFWRSLEMPLIAKLSFH